MKNCALFRSQVQWIHSPMFYHLSHHHRRELDRDHRWAAESGTGLVMQQGGLLQVGQVLLLLSVKKYFPSPTFVWMKTFFHSISFYFCRSTFFLFDKKGKVASFSFLSWSRNSKKSFLDWIWSFRVRKKKKMEGIFLATFQFGDFSVWQLFSLAIFQFGDFSVWQLFSLATF